MGTWTAAMTGMRIRNQMDPRLFCRNEDSRFATEGVGWDDPLGGGQRDGLNIKH